MKEAQEELVPLADRIGSVRWLRVALSLAVLLGAFSGATPLSVSAAVLVAVSGLYAIGLLTVEELSSRLAGRRTGLLGMTLLLDGLYLAWAGTVTGGTAGIVALLIVAHVTGVTLLVSYRTGVKVALWHSLLLYGAYQLHALGAAPWPAGFGAATYWWLLAYIVVLSAIAIGTALFSAINERELRRRRIDLEALAAFSSDLNAAGDVETVARALAERLRDALGFVRVVVVGGRDGSEVLASSGVDVAAAQVPPAGEGSVLRRACRQRRTVLVAHLAGDEDPGLAALLPGARNVVVLPLVTDDETVEAVVAEYGHRRPRIERRVVSAAERFADHGALALRTARLLAEVRTLATIDGLTGIANRRVFNTTLDAELSRAARTDEPVAVLLLDIDHFKAVNDDHGHQAGDEVLRALAAVLTAGIRDFDTAARYGGEEFAVIAPSCDLPAAQVIAERLRAGVEQARLPVAVTVSVGVAVTSAQRSTADTLIREADAALYASKRAGRNRVTLADASPVPG